MESANALQTVAPRTDARRVLVVDDHHTVRQSLAALINSESPSMLCVGIATSVIDVGPLVRDTQPDWVLLDADLAGEDGVALIPTIKALAACRVIVMSSHADAVLESYALRLGAAACIHKLAPAAELLKALGMSVPVSSRQH